MADQRRLLLWAVFAVAVFAATLSAQEEGGDVPNGPAQRVATTAALIENPKFDAWNEGIPVAWKTNRPEALSQSSGAGVGQELLLTPPSENVDISQFVDPALLLAGDTIMFQVEAYVEEAGNLEAYIHLNFAGENSRQITRDSHPGGGWQTIRTAVVVPDTLPQSVELRIRLVEGAKTPVRIRSASGEIVPLLP